MPKIKKSNSPWWQTVFDEVYLSAFEPLHSSQQTKKEVTWLIKTLGLKKNAQVLDIPCGTGRHSFELAKKGYTVTGIDFSKTLLGAARKRDTKEKKHPCFMKADMRSVSLRKRFDAIVDLGNSFGYCSDADNEKIIKNFSKLLKPNRFLVLDLPNTTGMLRQIKSHRKTKIKDGYILTEHIDFDPLQLIVTLRWTIVQRKKKTVFHGKLRLYTFPEIQSLLDDNNLIVKKVYGSFKGDKYSIDTPRMIIFAQKK
jgi:2-polyprenyl-3-methyl-5-hydroxy-6-metoxy-1,4-benzoquinol methylase